MALDLKSPLEAKFIAFTWARKLLVFDRTINFFTFCDYSVPGGAWLRMTQTYMIQKLSQKSMTL